MTQPKNPDACVWCGKLKPEHGPFTKSLLPDQQGGLLCPVPGVSSQFYTPWRLWLPIDPKSEVEQLKTELETIKEERDRLKSAIHEHWSQRADDRCIRDHEKLYAVAGLPPCDFTIGDPLAMAANCIRFIANECQAGGPWRSYKELEADNARLKSLVADTKAVLFGLIEWQGVVCDDADCPGDDTCKCEHPRKVSELCIRLEKECNEE